MLDTFDFSPDESDSTWAVFAYVEKNRQSMAEKGDRGQRIVRYQAES